MRYLFFFTFLAIVLNGCATTSEHDQKANAAELYKNIKINLAAGSYKEAITRLHTLESRFPFGHYAEQAKLDLMYAYFLNDDPDSVSDEVNTFVRENPRDPNTAYAYYIKGLAYFNSTTGPLQSVLNTDQSDRTPTNALKSFQAFQLLVRKFPNSKYATDARQRMIYLRNQLARFDIRIAQFYMARKAWVSALHRATDVIYHYPQSTSTHAALRIMITAYQKLGLTSLASSAQRVLAINEQTAKQGKLASTTSGSDTGGQR